MKKVVNVSLGGRNFTLEEDAYARLGLYLEHFKAKLTVPESQKAEVMDEIEGRIAELFFREVGDSGRVVNLAMVEQVAATLGMPDGSAESGSTGSSTRATGTEPMDTRRKLYRDPDDKRIGGVCSGMSYYFDVDVTLIRVLFIIALIAGLSGFWIYVILWITIPEATSAAAKCEMRGIPASAENMRRYSNSNK